MKMPDLRKVNWLVLIVLAVLLLLRLFFLGADPPIDLDASGGLFGDEGAYAHNARNMVLFGRWITDEWNPVFYSPLMTLATFLDFKVLGVGLVQLRLLYVLLSFLGLYLIYRALAENGRKRAGIILLILLGSNFIFLMHNRLGLADNFLLFLLPLAFYLWQRAWTRPANWLPAGVFCFLAYVGKSTAVYFVLAMFLASAVIWLTEKEPAAAGAGGGRWRPIWLFGGGFLAALLVWLFFFYLPNLHFFRSYSQQWFRLAKPQDLAQLWRNWSRPYFIKFLAPGPIVLILGLWALPRFILELVGRARRRSWTGPDRLEILAVCWLVVGAFFVSALNYHPLRYFVPLLPPLAILAALALDRLISGRSRRPYSRAFFVLEMFWLTGLVLLLIQYSPKRLWAGGLLALAACLIAFYLSVHFRPGWAKEKLKLSGPNIWPVILALSLIAASVAIDSYHWLGWAKNRQYTVYDTSKELGRILDQAYIAGLWAPVACLENRHRALCVGAGWFNDRDTFTRFPVTHLFLWDGNNREELRFMQKAYPEVMAGAKEIKVYTIKGLPTRLFRLGRPDH